MSYNICVEPDVVAHVQVKDPDKLAPGTVEDVILKVQTSIEKTARIKRVRRA